MNKDPTHKFQKQIKKKMAQCMGIIDKKKTQIYYQYKNQVHHNSKHTQKT